MMSYVDGSPFYRMLRRSVKPRARQNLSPIAGAFISWSVWGDGHTGYGPGPDLDAAYRAWEVARRLNVPAQIAF